MENKNDPNNYLKRTKLTCRFSIPCIDANPIEHLELANDKTLKTNDVIIRGIPLLENENTKLLKNVFVKISKVIGFDSSSCIIINIVRIISYSEILSQLPEYKRNLSATQINSSGGSQHSIKIPITGSCSSSSLITTGTVPSLSSSAAASSTSTTTCSSSSSATASASALSAATIVHGYRELIPIIIKFAVKSQQLEFLHKYYDHKTLNLLEIGFNVGTRIYISQALTKQTILLFRHAFAYKSKGLLKSVYLYRDSVYVRQSLSSEAIRIDDMNQINDLIQLKR